MRQGACQCRPGGTLSLQVVVGVGFRYVFLEFCILVVCRNIETNIGRIRFGHPGGIMGGRRRILLPMGTSGNYPFARTTISCEMV